MKILYDAVLKRPGCVLLQAAYGCDINTAHKFKADDWLVGLTPDLKIYEITDEQLIALVKITEDNREKSRMTS